MMSIEDLNLLVYPCILIDQSGDKVVKNELELKKGVDNNNEESIDKNNETEWKEVGGWRTVKRRLDNNKKVNYKNYYSESGYKNNKNI